MALTKGTWLGPYEILALLGTGGMGEVWKARDTRLNRFVAVKQLTGQHSGRFQQEARAIAALNHPHICQIYDVGATTWYWSTSRGVRWPIDSTVKAVVAYRPRRPFASRGRLRKASRRHTVQAFSTAT